MRREFSVRRQFRETKQHSRYTVFDMGWVADGVHDAIYMRSPECEAVA